MKNKEQQINNSEDPERNVMNQSKRNKNRYFPAIIAVALIAFGAWIYVTGLKNQTNNASGVSQQNTTQSADILSEAVTPSAGVELPARWGDLGEKMVSAGVINENKFKSLYDQNDGLTTKEAALIDSPNNGNIVITQQNAGIILNLLWALGLGNENPLLENGPMQNPQYGGVGNFASTGGWTVAVGNPISHYSAHQFITLTPDEQALVENVSKNIYRPCCGNSTYFPDCNHGMAMLGPLELMASQGATENQMYKAALAVNSYWFPDNYMTIARYFANKGINWNEVNPKTVLGAAYSSIQGYQAVQNQVAPIPQKSSASCGVSLQNQNERYSASTESSKTCGV